MNRGFPIVFIAFIFNCCIASASPGDSLLVGTWKGTSICQIKSSPCHDEIAAYHIKKGDKEGVYSMLMNKIVNGAEEEMGVLEYTYDATVNTLTCKDEKHNTLWVFTVKGKTIEGTLHYKGQLYRVIKLKKDE